MNVATRGIVSDYAKQALLVVRTITANLLAECVNEDSWEELKTILAAVPLAASDYGLLANRLRNARRYAALGEAGAARFELKLLGKSLYASTEPSFIKSTRKA